MNSAADFQRLTAAQARLARAMAEPRVIALVLIGVLALAGWLYTAAASASLAGAGIAVGPLTSLLSTLSSVAPEFFTGFAERLVLPTHMIGEGAGVSMLLAFVMWAAMSLAMMLPTAAPMMVTYAEIAETAAEKGRRVVSLFALLAGFALIWLGFSFIAALVQVALAASGILHADGALALPWLAAATLIFAGAYQFSALKTACLTKCRRPFAFFFSRWTERPLGVLRLGAEQGTLCLGCCWALMTVMFVTGLMNLAWMAVLAIVMTLEKVLPRPGAVRVASGVGLIAWGLLVAAQALSPLAQTFL